jgi:predicted dehydrogenase
VGRVLGLPFGEVDRIAKLIPGELKITLDKAIKQVPELKQMADTEGEQGFRTILATDPGHPYVDHWWPPGHVLGWEHSHVHQMFELCDAIGSDRMPDPSFADGERCQAVLEACAQSAESGQWVGIPA